MFKGRVRVRTARNAYETVQQDGEPFDFFPLITGIGAIRQRVDKNEYRPAAAVLDDLAISLDSRRPLFAGFNVSSSLFSSHTREGGIMEITRNDELIFCGIIKDSVCEYDARRSVENIKLLSPMALMQRVNVPGGQIIDGMLWTEAIRSCFSHPLLVGVVNFDGDFTHTDFAENIDRDTLTVADTSSLTGKSAYETLIELMTICLGVVRVSPHGVCSIYSRNRATTNQIITITDETLLDISKVRSGASRGITDVVVNIAGETDNEIPYRRDASAALFGNETPQDFTLSWITETAAGEQFARWLTRYTAYPQQEITLTVPAALVYNANPRFGIFDRVLLDFGDGAKYPAAFGAAYSSEAYNTSLNGVYRCFGTEYDLQRDIIKMQLRS